MNAQLAYALKKVLISIVLAALGIVAASQNDILAAAGADPLIYGGIVSGVVFALTRVFEGYRDGQRANGDDVVHMQKSDVGFKEVLAKAEVEHTARIVAAVADDKGEKLDLHVVRVSPSVVDPFNSAGSAVGSSLDSQHLAYDRPEGVKSATIL